MDDDGFWNKALEHLQSFKLQSYSESILQSVLHRIRAIAHKVSIYYFRNKSLTKQNVSYHTTDILLQPILKVIFKNCSILNSDPHYGRLFQQIRLCKEGNAILKT